MSATVASAFMLGLFIGCLLGVLTMAIMFVSKAADPELGWQDVRQFVDSEPEAVTVFPQTRQQP